MTMHENKDRRRFFITATQLQKLVATKLHCAECFNQRCMLEKTNMQSAILSLAEVFDDAYFAYIAQEKLLAEIISKTNEISLNFGLQNNFALPPNSNEKISRLHRMAKMIRTLLLKPKNNHKIQTNKVTASETPVLTNFSNRIRLNCETNCKSTQSDYLLKNGSTNTHLKNSSDTKMTTSSNSSPTMYTIKKCSISAQSSKANYASENLAINLVKNDENNLHWQEVISNINLQKSTTNYNRLSPIPKQFTSQTANGEICANQSLPQFPRQLKMAKRFSSNTSKSNMLASDAVVVLSDDDDSLFHEQISNSNYMNNIASTSLLTAPKPAIPCLPNTLYKFTAQGDNNYCSVSVNEDKINTLPSVITKSQLFCSSTISSALSSVADNSSLLISSSLAPILDAINRSSIKTNDSDFMDSKPSDYLPPAKRFCGKTQLSRNLFGKSANQYMSSNGRFYIANSLILFSSNIHPLPFSTRESSPKMCQLSAELKLKRLTATIYYKSNLCIVKFYVEYETLLLKQKFYLHYYLKNSADADPTWQIGDKFNCKADGKLSMTMQFEDAKEDEILFMSSRIGTDDAGIIGEYSTPIAIKLGRASDGDMINVNFEALSKRKSKKSLSSKIISPNNTVEVIDLE